MQNTDIKAFLVKEALIIAVSVGAAIALAKYLPAFESDAFPARLAGLLYLASIAFRLAGFFIKMTFHVAIMLAAIVLLMLYLAARYPQAFAFLKQ